jgi:hypothetical protein
MSTNQNPVNHCDDSPRTGANAESLEQCLINSGFQVQPGQFTLVDVFELYRNDTLDTCNGNNAGNPYFACSLPLSPGQTCSDYSKICSPEPGGTFYLDFRLQPDAAIVLVGMTPPKMKYFSYCAFLSSRVRECIQDPKADQLQILPIRTTPIIDPQEMPDPIRDTTDKREIVFGGLGNTLNNFSISTPGGSDNPFGQQVVIIFTASQDLSKQITQIALEYGYPSSAINTLVIPKDYANLGTDVTADTIAIVNRTAQPEDQEAFKQYCKDPSISVYRVTGPSNSATRYFPIPNLTPRGDGRTELSLSKPLHKLRQAILEKYQDNYDAVELQTNIWFNESSETILQNLNNVGESRDAAYLATDAFIMPEGAFAVAYGVNHAKTEKSCYSMVSVYGQDALNGVVDVANKDFPGSASEYINDEAAEFLYAWKFSYDKNQDMYSTYIPNRPEEQGKKEPRFVDPGKHIFFGFRAYVEPTTKVGPAYQELLFDRVLVFVPKQP